MTNDKGDPIADIGLKSARDTIQPIENDCAVSPSCDIFNRDLQSVSNMAKQLSE